MDADRLIYGTARWKAVRRTVRARDGNACVQCGRGSGVLDVDHIVPPAPDNPGTWFAMSNLRLLCRSCHRKRMSTAGDVGDVKGSLAANPTSRHW